MIACECLVQSMVSLSLTLHFFCFFGIRSVESHSAGECAFCPSVTIRYDGKIGDTAYSGKCSASEWCWKGGFFSFMSPVKTIKVEPKIGPSATMNIQVWCDGLPNYRQCAVSGTFLVAGSAVLIFLTACCCITITTWCLCRRRRRSRGYSSI